MITIKRPVLFLDFDGVLFDLTRSDKTEDDWDDEFGPFFDAEKTGYIEALQHETNCRIVILSSWRHRAEGGKNAMQRMMDERGIALVIDDTVLLHDDPRNAQTSRNRSREINLWLADHADEEIGHIAILDDAMRPGYFLDQHFAVHVQTFWSGMTKSDYHLTRGLLLDGPNQALVNRPAPSRPAGPRL